MTDTDINLRLAFAIGWPRVHVTGATVFVHTSNDIDKFKDRGMWIKGRIFDYRDPAVIWPIAEKYSLFPSGIDSGSEIKAGKQGYPEVDCWECCWWDFKLKKWNSTNALSAAKCVALAAIESKGNRGLT
jgi:hypothetical protein